MHLKFGRCSSGVLMLSLGGFVWVCLTTPGVAQPVEQTFAAVGDRPSAAAVRIEASEAPTIDADLSDSDLGQGNADYGFQTKRARSRRARVGADRSKNSI